MSTLSKQQRLFVESFDGDEVSTMRLAGYVGSDAYLKKKYTEIMKLPQIIDALNARDAYSNQLKNAIATRQERQAIWTAIMRNDDPYRKEEKDSNGVPIEEGNIPLATRLKASELLGKSETDFVEKIDMSMNVSHSDLIMQSYQVDTPIEAIEAEYYKAKLAEPKPALPEKLEDLI